MNDSTQLPAPAPHIFNCHVFIEDTDCYGVVYHANYVKFIERARSQMLADVGLGLAKAQVAGYLFVVKKLMLDYHKAAKLGDDLIIESKVIKKGSVTLVVAQDVYRIDIDNNEKTLLVSAEVKAGCVDANLRPAKIPEFDSL